MRTLKLVVISVLVAVILLEYHFFFASPLDLRNTLLKPRETPSSNDIIPQPLKHSPSQKLVFGEESFYFNGHIPQDLQDRFDAGIVDETYFSYYENGEIHPPKKYDVESKYPAQDIGKMKIALNLAHRYADINNALEDGYRIEDAGSFSDGMGTHVLNIGYILDDEVSVEKPEFLNYVKNRETGRFQLVQMGFIAQRTTSYKLFEAKDAVGHFHVGNFCFVAGDVYMRHPVSAIKDINGNSIPPGLSVEGSIFDIIETSNLATSEDICREFSGGEVFGPDVWMMHFAVNMYNEFGMFADYFPYVDYLSANAVSHSFFGEKL